MIKLSTRHGIVNTVQSLGGALGAAVGVALAVAVAMRGAQLRMLKRQRDHQGSADDECRSWISCSPRNVALTKCAERSKQHARLRKASKKEINDVASEKTSGLTMRLDYLDRFLRWDCGLVLQQMGLFPNAKEITESMACLNAVEKHLAVRFSDVDTLCVVVGDGSTPRTAALLAMRSKWRRIISIDPTLAGLPLASCQGLGPQCGDVDPQALTDAARKKRRLNREEQMAHQASQEAPRRERMRDKLERIAELDRLELVPVLIENHSVTVEAGIDLHVVVFLPHAHVAPEIALNVLHADMAVESTPPTVSAIQLPCCRFKRHNCIFGHPPDVEYVDTCICGPEQQVRVWRNVPTFRDRRDVEKEANADVTGKRRTGRRKGRKFGSSQLLVNFKATSQPHSNFQSSQVQSDVPVPPSN